MNRQQLHSADWVVIVIFGIIALCSGSFALLMLFSSVFTEPEYATLVPAMLGPCAGALGVMLMVYYRRRLGITPIPLIIAAVLWFFGASLLAFTGFAVFDYNEPAEFLPNIGYSLALCLVPGVFLAGMGVLLYWSDALRNRPKHTGYDDYINDLKDDELL